MWEVDPQTRSKLHQIQKKEGSGNDKCCDCGAPSPQWASPKFSTFICLTCAGTHRGLGVHISFVRSISMDAFKQNEILRMQQGGNKAWQDFYNQNVSGGGSFEEATVKERYESEVGEEWKELLSAKIEGRMFDRAAWLEQRAEVIRKQNQAVNSRTGTPPVSSSAGGGPKRAAVSGIPGSRSESPSAHGSQRSSIPNTQKAKNETYFAQLGSANASRPNDLPPSQGGKYGGFGSGGAAHDPAAASRQGGAAGASIPSANEFQEDPVAALTKGFGWFSAAVGRQVKVVNEGFIQPTAKNIAASDFAAQARVVAAQAGQGIQTGAKTAAESINRFVEGQDETRGTGPGAGRQRVEPERRDFWDSFGESAAVEKEKPSSIGTAAVKKGGGNSSSGPGSRATSGTSAGAAAPAGKDDGWGDDW